MYRFCLGASGAGKSTYLQREVIRKAGEALDGLDSAVNYIFLVPEQYTMQTQKELVLASGERGGILNVDVLSFGRLAHRVFEEIGAEPRGILDDMGKSLILRRLSLRHRGELSVLGPRIGRPGMTAEVKSVISEFMQYGITPGDAADLADYARAHGQGRLAAKLSDIGLLYQAFLDERKERFLTGEEQYDLLAEAIPKSLLIARSVVLFDGFTGFTPVEARVILSLMQCAREVIFAFDWGEDGGTPLCDVVAGLSWDEQDLFGLTRQSVAQISRIAREGGVGHGADIYIGKNNDLPPRFAANPAMAHLERTIFRSPAQKYLEEKTLPAAYQDAEYTSAPYKELVTLSAGPAAGRLPVHLVQASNPGQEVRQMCIRIRRLIEQNGWAYRDFAVIAGDLATYEDEIRVFAGRYDLPVYIDAARPASLNPLTETIRAALQIGAGDYSYETVFRFFRSGLAGLCPEEIDRLENYCLKRGISSRKRWESAFDAEFEPMRLRFLAAIRPLQDQGRATAGERTRSLYAFLTGIRAGEQMQQLSGELKARGKDAEAMEYGQLYGAMIHLLDELYDLPGEDPISARDYLELVETGFAEIRLGTLPQQADRILVGDLERTRLSEVKVLFVLGVNDGLIPKAASSGGLLSDLDRSFLEESGILQSAGRTLSPTPRQQMANQRFYLYMNLTQPSRELILSYAATSGEGKSIRPSYLVGALQQLFPGLSVELPEEAPVSEQLTSPKDTAGFLAASLRSYADCAYLKDPVRTDELLTIYGYCAGSEAAFPPQQQAAGSASALRSGHRIRDLRDAAFLKYRPVPIRQETARALYGRVIRGSATRLERAAQCYLQQFLRNGLHLREREEYTFKAADSGTILHDSLLRFGQLLRQEGLSWTQFTEEEGRELSARALRETAGAYRDQVLYATARDGFRARRMQRILERTVQTLQFQLAQGDFLPESMEQEFGQRGELSYDLGNGRRLILTGRIDRVDLSREEGRIYVKILDYKSGSHELKEKEMRAGLQLQLMVYMNAERQILAERHPGTQIVPAAMLYYHFDDPLLKDADAQKVLREPAGRAGEQGTRALRMALRPTGKVINEGNALVRLDHALEKKKETSLVVPVKTNKEGAPSKVGDYVLSGEEFDALSKDVEEVICRLARDILSGRIDASPVSFSGGRSACTYCPYADACGFDRRTPGYEYREIGK